MTFALQLIKVESMENGIDFVLRGSATKLYEIMDEAIERYGDGFLCGDMRILEHMSNMPGMRKVEMACRFLKPDEAMLFKLSLPLD